MAQNMQTRYEAEAQYHDEPVSHAGPNSHMPSFFWNTTRVVNWGIQYLKTKKPPVMLDGQVRAPLRILTAGSAFNPNPLTAQAAAPATNYAGSGPVRAPSLNEGSALGAQRCG